MQAIIWGFCLILSVLSLPVLAGSSVYKCKDTNGRIVFQQTPCSEANIVGDSDVHKMWHEMRALSAEAKFAIATLGADVESIKQCKRAIAVYNEKVDALLPEVNKYAKDYEELLKAHGYLKDCGMCRTSAEAYCRRADHYLDLVASKLTEN